MISLSCLNNFDPHKISLIGFCAVSKHQTLQAFQQARPSLGPATFVAPSASLIGNVTLGTGSSVWYNAVLRGELVAGDIFARYIHTMLFDLSMLS